MSDYWEDLPVIRPTLMRYFAEGLLPVSPLLQSVLKNDLATVILRYDGERRISVLRNTITFLVDRAPEGCWGSAEAVANWVMIGGENGRRAVLTEYTNSSGRSPL